MSNLWFVMWEEIIGRGYDDIKSSIDRHTAHIEWAAAGYMPAVLSFGSMCERIREDIRESMENG